MELSFILWIIVAVFILMLLVVFILRYIKKEQKAIKQQPQFSPTQEDKSTRRQTIMALALGIIVVIGYIVYSLLRGGEREAGDLSSFFPFVWIVIMIPVLTQKRKQATTPQQKKLLLMGVLVMILLVAVTIFSIEYIRLK